MGISSSQSHLNMFASSPPASLHPTFGAAYGVYDWDADSPASEPGLAPERGLGLPGRRMLRSAPIGGTDGGYTFLTRFRNQAQRFGHSAKFSCPPLTPADTKAVSDGEMAMWCAYGSQDDVDLMVFSLIIEEGEAKIDYVGFFDERPAGPMKADGEPPAPPVRISDVKRATARADLLNRPDSVNLNPGTGPRRAPPQRPSPPSVLVRI